VKRNDPVATLVLYGDVPEAILRLHAERLKDELIVSRIATEVALESVRSPEILISVPEVRLRQYGITIGQVAEAVAAFSIDLPLGSVHGERGDYLLRVREAKRSPKDFLNIPIKHGTDGGEITIGTLAEVSRGWEDVQVGARYSGKRAVVIRIDKTEVQDTAVIAEGVHTLMMNFRKTLPGKIGLDTFTDQSSRIKGRLNVLISNGIMGLVLVFLVLWFFTEIRVAFWVAWGIPVAFLGTIFAMYVSGMTLNMITMFGLIMVLGMIVDDAVVVSENIFTRFRKGATKFDAAYEGTIGVFWPVVAASVTTIGAFTPLMFVSGKMGRTMGALPWVVVAALAVSLIEVFFSLPKHLEHSLQRADSVDKKRPRLRRRIEDLVESFVERGIGPLLGWVLRVRYWVIGAAIAIVLLSIGMPLGGRLLFTFFPVPDTNSIVARVRYPLGTRLERTMTMAVELEEALKRVEAKLGDHTQKEGRLIERVLIRFGETSIDTDRGGHLAQVQVELRDAELRSVTSDKVLSVWRSQTKILPGVNSVNFSRLERGVGGKELDIRLVGDSWGNLEAAAGYLINSMSGIPGVSNLETDLRPGKEEIYFVVNEEGQRMGLTPASLASQVRNSFFGAVVQSFQEGDEDVKVRIVYPERQRMSLEDVRNVTIAIPSSSDAGMRVPLLQVANMERLRGWAELKHLDRRRSVAIAGEVDERITTAGQVLRGLRPILLNQIPERFPGVRVRLEGQRATQQETVASLKFGAFVGLLIVLSVLILTMDSWTLPLIVLSIVPMGFVGMIWGHILMGHKLIMLSVMAGIALGGVVVNDAIILMDHYKRELSQSKDTREALVLAVKRRFRPIVMTTVTTVAGLLPMLLETSIQAQFLIPMAITIAFGLMTGTIGTLVFLPALIQIMEDMRGFFRTPVSRG
jgi:HAE1 family hydrophobic/amphiphilic exporter-1